MPITHSEKYGSPVFTIGANGSGVRTYNVVGSADESEIKDYVETNMPSTFLDMPLRDITVQIVHGDMWEATARYAVPSGEFTGPGDDIVEGFDIGTSTVRVTQSRSTVDTFERAGFDPPDFKGAIGVNGQEVEGVDVVVPQAITTRTAYKDASEVDTDYQNALIGLVGSVNSETFLGRAAGEVLFLGATGSRLGNSGKYEITFKFAISPNRSGFSHGDITGIDKAGWDYLWFYYDSTTNANKLVKRPAAAYVERVYPQESFSALGLSA